MGYYIFQEDTKFFIPAEKVSEAVTALKNLKDAEGKEPKLSWVNAGWQNKPTFAEMMQALRWDVELDDDNNVCDISFTGEKSGGDEDITLSNIAHCVKAGSYINMRGEDGELWQWYFNGDYLVEKFGKVFYE